MLDITWKNITVELVQTLASPQFTLSYFEVHLNYMWKEIGQTEFKIYMQKQMIKINKMFLKKKYRVEELPYQKLEICYKALFLQMAWD